MKRREALKVTAGAVVLPSLLSAQTPKGKTWKPSVFTSEQDAAVVSLTEIVIPTTDTPGAKQAGVNRYIDLLLHDGPASERERFVAGLEWLDDYATKKNGKSFAKLTAAEQTAIVAELDAEGTPDLEKGHQFFRMAKNMTSRIYYSTAIGYKELNKGGRVPKTFGCEHSGHA
jgi:hypothetical protein